MDAEPFDSVLVVGEAASTPLPRRALSEAFGRSVVVPREPGAAVARAAAGIAARRAEALPAAPHPRAEPERAAVESPRSVPRPGRSGAKQPWPAAGQRADGGAHPRQGRAGAHRRPRIGALVAAGATAVVVALGGGDS